VNGPESVRAVPEVDAVTPLDGERVGELAGPLEGLGDELADLPEVRPALADAG